MTSRRVATVKTLLSLTVAAATPHLWVTALFLYFAARPLGLLLEPRLHPHHHHTDQQGAVR